MIAGRNPSLQPNVQGGRTHLTSSKKDIIRFNMENVFFFLLKHRYIWKCVYLFTEK